MLGRAGQAGQSRPFENHPGAVQSPGIATPDPATAVAGYEVAISKPAFTTPGPGIAIPGPATAIAEPAIAISKPASAIEGFAIAIEGPAIAIAGLAAR